MPVTVVVGGQFGSEGKGKVAHAFARRADASIAVRVGGSNSGHTAIDDAGKAQIFRCLPTAALLPNVTCVLPAGSYIDVEILRTEIERINLSPERLFIDPNAVVITNEHKATEANEGLQKRIGSTGSGTGAALVHRIQRREDVPRAVNHPLLAQYVRPTTELLREALSRNERVVIEGTQGFGLSVLHSTYYPKATSRDTTAAAFISEAGLSPLDVDNVVLVIRAFPIRVSGDSGPLPNEIDWSTVTSAGKHDQTLEEKTSATGRIRRVANFDPEIVQKAMQANAPNIIVLNHVDYFSSSLGEELSRECNDYVSDIEKKIGRAVDWVGLSPDLLIARDKRIRVVANG